MSLDAGTRQRKESVRFYSFEDLLFEFEGCEVLKRRMSITQLQLCAGYVWAREGRSPETCPVIRPRRQPDSSYWWPGEAGGRDTIHLIQKHRSLGGLLHELAHALGRRDKLNHGPAFRKRCLRLYAEYGDWNGRIA